jgi:hypothetical protein
MSVYFISIIHTAQVVAALAGVVILGINAYGVYNTSYDFDRFWYLPDNSYQSEFAHQLSKHFPANSFNTEVYLGTVLADCTLRKLLKT